MKKSLILLFFLLCASKWSDAQRSYFYDDYYYQLEGGFYTWVPTYNDPFPRKDNNYYYGSLDSASIKRVANIYLKRYHFERQKLKAGEKKGLTKIDKLYAPNGKPLSYSASNINQKKNQENKKEAYLISYTPSDQIKEYASYRKGDILKHKTCYSYDSIGLLKQTIGYKGKKIKYTGRTSYEWFSKGKAKLITYYSRKEYKPRVVSFDCLPEGKNENTRKDTTTICKNTEVDANGNRIEINTTRDKKGREYKTISRFDKKNNFVTYERYNVKGKYKSGWETTYNENGKETSINEYKKNKKLNRAWEYTFNAENKVIKTQKFNRKRKLKITYLTVYSGQNATERTTIRKEGKRKGQQTRTTYEYDGKNNLIKTASYNKANELRWAKKMEYTDNGLYQKIENYNKNNELRDVTTYSFEYYK